MLKYMFILFQFVKEKKTQRENRRDLTPAHDTSPYHNRTATKNKAMTQMRHQKLRLHSHCGTTSDGKSEWITVIQQVWLTGLRVQPSHYILYLQKLFNQKATY